MFPEKLYIKLNDRKATNALRQLVSGSGLVDFSSNDYLGFSNSEDIFNKTHLFLEEQNLTKNGATGSRLLTGNHNLYDVVEKMLCDFHKSEAALIFNSGYDANVGFFSCVPQRGDVVLYDEYIHASIRDGMTMGNAKTYKFRHNDLDDLNKKCQTERNRSQDANIFIVTESIFSMDGDSPNLKKLSKCCNEFNAYLVVDEAHAVGVLGVDAKGLVQHFDLEREVFARIITFGKAMGCHGAAILGSQLLRDYLLNFSRSFIYTTALPQHSLATVKNAYEALASDDGIKKNQDLLNNIVFFKTEMKRLGLEQNFIESNSAIQSMVIQGNDCVKRLSTELMRAGFNLKPILSPTVPKNQERLRFCLHAFNTKAEISGVLESLKKLTCQ